MIGLNAVVMNIPAAEYHLLRQMVFSRAHVSFHAVEMDFKRGNQF
jgi:hypothetical protein